MNTDIQKISDFLAEMMDGQETPVCGSEAEQQLFSAIRRLLARKRSQDFEVLGHMALSLVINRMSSSIGAAQALQNFIQGGDHA